MKYFIFAIIFLALVLIGYNITILDFSNLLGENSSKALIAILASFSVVILMLILLVSRRISKKHREQ